MAAKTVRLHLGAHKTASTYIQETLLLNRAQSAAAGVAFWPMRTVRSIFEQIRAQAAAAKPRKWNAIWRKQEYLHEPSKAKLKRLFFEGYEITISEENILGHTNDCYYSPFYRRASRTLNPLGELLKDRPVEVYLAVRSYAPFLMSMYSESLKFGMYSTPEQILSVNQTCAGQWPHVIDMIRRAIPHAEIFVWPFEDFALIESEVLSRLSGLPSDSLQRLAKDDVQPTASKEAIEQMIQEAGHLTAQQRVFRMLSLTAKHPRSASKGERFMPWPEEDQVRLQSEYEADLAEIGARNDVTLLG